MSEARHWYICYGHSRAPDSVITAARPTLLSFQEDEPADPFSSFPTYNRDLARYNAILAEKETAWEDELKRLMEKSGRRASAMITGAQQQQQQPSRVRGNKEVKSSSSSSSSPASSSSH